MPFGVMSGVSRWMDVLDGVGPRGVPLGKGVFWGFYVPTALNSVFLKTEMYRA